MSNNITILSLDGDVTGEDNPKEKVIDFFKEKMDMEIKDEEVETAHRLGKKTGVKPRLMVVRCTHSLRSRIFNFTHNLKGKTNSRGDYYNVQPQLPEPLLSEKISREEQLKSIRKANQAIPEEEKDKRVQAYIKNKTLIVNNVPQKQRIHPPPHCTRNLQSATVRNYQNGTITL